MSLSRRLRTPALACIAVLVAGFAVAVAAPASVGGAGTRAHPATVATAATSYNGYVSQVAGTFGSGGTVTGFFVPTRSYVASSKAYVQGDLTLTLRRSTGTLLTGVSKHDVALPVNAPGGGASAASVTPNAICPILHLVLGPLNLNLLGLVIHLNRVVLDITARSGPGNLLGNLLCALAHLLDRTSPSILDLLNLSNTLNRIISIVT